MANAKRKTANVETLAAAMATETAEQAKVDAVIESAVNDAVDTPASTGKPDYILGHNELMSAIESIADIVKEGKEAIAAKRLEIETHQLNIFGSCLYRVKENGDLRPIFGMIRNAKFLGIAKKLMPVAFPNVMFKTSREDGKTHVFHSLIDSDAGITVDDSLYNECMAAMQAGEGIKALKDFVPVADVERDGDKHVTALTKALRKQIADGKLSIDKMGEVLATIRAEQD